MVAVALLEAATAVAPAAAAAKVDPGWTWTATMGLMQNLLLAGGGAGLGGLIIRATVQLKRIGNERAKQEDDREGSRWTEVMDFNDRLQKRVEKLEEDNREERRRADKEVSDLRASHAIEMADLRQRHDEEIRGLRLQIESMQRTITQWQVSGVNLLAATNAPSTIARTAQRLDDIKGVGEA